MTLERRYLEGLLANGAVELRCFDSTSNQALERKQKLIWSGIYDGYGYLSQAIRYAMKSGWDIYHTLNPLKIPATNSKLKPFVRTTRDSDVTGYKTLFIDLDVVGKESGLTDGQVAAAMDHAFKIVDYLDDHGFEVPTVGCSGNGVHIRYNIDLPVSEKERIRGFILALSKRFSTDEITVDRVVFNEARIARCLGTVNTKGGRHSSIKMLSNHLTDADTFITLADSIIPPKEKPKHWVKTEGEEKRGKFIKNWDVVGAFTSAGLYLGGTPEGGKHWVTCINAGAHSATGSTDTVIWEREWPSYHCSHDHCSGLDISDAIHALGGV